MYGYTCSQSRDRLHKGVLLPRWRWQRVQETGEHDGVGGQTYLDVRQKCLHGFYRVGSTALYKSCAELRAQERRPRFVIMHHEGSVESKQRCEFQKHSTDNRRVGFEETAAAAAVVWFMLFLYVDDVIVVVPVVVVAVDVAAVVVAVVVVVVVAVAAAVVVCCCCCCCCCCCSQLLLLPTAWIRLLRQSKSWVWSSWITGMERKQVIRASMHARSSSVSSRKQVIR